MTLRRCRRLFVADLRHLASLSVTLDFELLFQEASTDWWEGGVKGYAPSFLRRQTEMKRDSSPAFKRRGARTVHFCIMYYISLGTTDACGA